MRMAWVERELKGHLVPALINSCTSPTWMVFLTLLQLNKLEEAANAAHTFFMANPEHMEIQQDIENYKTTAGKVSLIDLEAKPHMVSLS